MVSSNRLAPYETGQLLVTVDTSGKTGRIFKYVNIYSNDKGKPVKTLLVSATVAASPSHPFPKEKFFFSKECASCHVEKGKGKKGKELYEADCAFCHGSRGWDRTASGLIRMRERERDYLREVIINGLPGTPMPGWGKKNGGPLSEEEVGSLVEYIKNWR